LKVEIYRLDTISLTRSALPEATELGNTTTITLTLTNTGTADLSNVTVKDTIPVVSPLQPVALKRITIF